MLRAITVAIALLCATPADAAIPCWKVRAAIAWAGSLESAEVIARQHGYTASEIAEARKCFRAART